MFMHNVTNVTINAPNSRQLGTAAISILTVLYGLGIIGNAAALYTLCKGDYKYRKSIHMLRCLATNDLVALLVVLILLYLKVAFPFLALNYWFCVSRVISRVFGLGSGCVAIVMAIERWLALTKPFLYKKYVTYKVVKRAILSLWAIGAFLTCLPLLGFGLYYKKECLRYRDATEPKDIAYAYIFCTFGTLLCACIVYCNLCVMKELARIGNRKRMLVRRVSRSCSRNSNNENMSYTNPTAEELAFAKLMAVLCISFVICWMPQMISTIWAQLGTKSQLSSLFSRIADLLMAVHFTLDPYVYVLLRFKKNKSRSNGNSSIPLHQVPSDTNTKSSQLIYER